MSSFIIIKIDQLTEQIGAFTLSHRQLNSSMTYKRIKWVGQLASTKQGAAMQRRSF
jgi:hypothetical protein